MRLLLQFSRLLYFLLCMIFIVFVFIYQKSSDVNVHIYILLLFSFLLLPLFEGVINTFIIPGEIKKYFQNKSNLIATGVFLASIIGFLFVGKLSLLALICIFLIYALYTKIDGRVFFVGALFVFVYVAFYLLFGQYESAERLSIYAYYFLIAGVAFQILENIIPFKPQS